jgi:folate-binding protein YgfZ
MPIDQKIYQAGITGRLWRDLSHYGLFRVSGADAAALLHHLTTSDVKKLSVGSSQEGVLISNKGRVLDWLTLLRLAPHEFLVITSPNRREFFAPYARRVVLFRQDVTIKEEKLPLFCVFGPQAQEVATGAGWFPTQRLRGGGFLRVPAPGEHLGQPVCDDAVFNVLRVEAGLPVYGRELSEAVNPWEAGFDSMIALDKGCYNGQEVVARLHTYNKVKQKLMGLRLDSLVGAAAPLKLKSQGKEAGTLTSAVESPRFGPVGLGYLRNDYQPVGTVVFVGEDEERTATVCALPFAL